MSHAIYNPALLIGAGLSALAALLHVGIIIKGAPWYRFFGAGKRFAQAAEKGHGWHDVVTLGVTAVLAAWAVYALSGAGLIGPLPWLKLVLCMMTALYVLRGVLGFLLLLVPQRTHSTKFLVVSSAICLGFGGVHLLGLVQMWEIWSF
jgi:hypothetical protein